MDDVVGKILDNVIELYGSSAQDVYGAIISTVLAKERMNEALGGVTFENLIAAVRSLQQVDHSTDNNKGISHHIFCRKPTGTPGSFNDSEITRFQIDFKSPWIRTVVFERLGFLQDIDKAAMIRAMRPWPLTNAASFADWVYEGFAAKVLSAGETTSSPLVRMHEEVKNSHTLRFFVPPTPTGSKSEGAPSTPFNRKRKPCLAHFSRDRFEFSNSNDPAGDSIGGRFWIPGAPQKTTILYSTRSSSNLRILPKRSMSSFGLCK